MTAWICGFLEGLCDQSPIDAEYYMPPGMTKTLLYDTYKIEIERSAFNLTAYTYDRFCKVFKKEYPRVHKAKDTFLAKCDICVRWADPSTKKLSAEEYVIRRAEYVLHLQQQSVRIYIYVLNSRKHMQPCTILSILQKLRLLYVDRALASSNDPKKMWCIAADFASAQYAVGQFPKSKSYDAILNKPEVVCDTCLELAIDRCQMICGIINHALNKTELHFIADNYVHDSSLSISILHEHLMRRLKETRTRPEVLQIQADNSGKDNKNKYLFGYCAVSL